MIKLDELWLGIFTNYKSSDLSDLIDKFYHARRPPNESPPHLVFSVVEIDPDYRIGRQHEPIEHLTVQFELSTNGPDTAFADQVMEVLENEFGIGSEKIPVNEYSHCYSVRQELNISNDDEVWVYSVVYEMVFRKD